MLPPFFGNSIYEATIPFTVTLIMTQCGDYAFFYGWGKIGKNN
jgi:hypothetical protein